LSSTHAATPAPRSGFRRLFDNVELVTVILLGIVSVATAYTSFQSGLYGGASDDRISRSEAKGTEAESLYLEANQQYVQDTQTILRLSDLDILRRSADPVTAFDSAAQYNELYFIGVSEDLDPAIQSAAALDISEPDFWHDPQADDAYNAALFGSYADASDESEKLRSEGDKIGDQGDQLGFYTALMAITLFLLGVAAVVRRPLMQWILIAVGMTIFLVTAVGTAFIPFVWIGF
jgi:hypothetical protein